MIYCISKKIKSNKIDFSLKRELYQFQKADYQCTELIEATDEQHFPIVAYNEAKKKELKENYSLSYAPFELQRSGCRENCSLYIQLQAPSAKVYSYTFFVKMREQVTARVYEKNKFKYLEDSLITFLSFVILMYVITQLQEDNLNENKLTTYMYFTISCYILLVE